MSFLKDFGNALNSQYGLGESASHDLPISKRVDRSEDRSYIESGYISNIRPRATEIIMKEPDITVVVKKRMFSSLAENYRTDLMSEDEKLFVRATKKLFHNKCKAIAAYERLSKIERVTKAAGMFNDYALPQVFNAIDTLNGLGLNILSAETQSTLETIRKVKDFSDPNFVTTWITDSRIPYVSDLGEGTGVFELTLVSSATIVNSINPGGGSAALTIEDPYKLMVVTRRDIDLAISQVTSFTNNSFYSISSSNLDNVTDQLSLMLDNTRAKRNTSPIKFSINDKLVQSNKVRAYIADERREILFSFDGGVLGFNSEISIDPSAYSGPNGLSSEDEKLFKQIISNIYQSLALKQTSENQIMDYKNKPELKYVYKNMMLHYNGKPIIQAQDVVHIFVGSKTKVDSRISQGLSVDVGAGGLSKLNSTMTSFNKNFSSILSQVGASKATDNAIEIEKESIVGPNFPTWLWVMMRNDFTRQAAGVHRFGGVVESSSHTYNNGKYTVSVSVKDNFHYFKMGKVNINPSVDVYNGALFDPVTPFKLDFDSSSGLLRGEIPELLDENKRLLNTGCIKAKNGRFRGLTLNEQLWKVPSVEYTSEGGRKVFHDPDGFVYRWKSGIGTLIWKGDQSANLSLGSFSGETGLSINKEPFAGQDVMNVLSLLITGVPYNYNTFIKSAIQSNNISRDDFSNQNGSKSYLRGLISDLSKQNATWGNFIPFKKLSINQAAYKFMISGQFDISAQNSRLDSLMKERAKLFDEYSSVNSMAANNPLFYVNAKLPGGDDSNRFRTLEPIANKLIDLDMQIRAEQRNLSEIINATNQDGALSIYGDEISYEPEISTVINPRVQRLLWKVKANDDQNFLIIDDAYDKNYDIQAFERSLTESFSLFNSTYTDLSEKIQAVQQMIGLEVFADSQGHIQIRPPQYNRMPSSVYYNMLRDKQKYGIQLFPEFLEGLFFNQIQGLTDRLEIVEDEIRARTAALGLFNDKDAQDMINSSSIKGSPVFQFITDESGNVGTKDFKILLSQNSPDLNDQFSTSLEEFNTQLSGALNKGLLFDATKRVELFNSKINDNSDIVTKVQEILNRLQQKKGFSDKKVTDLVTTTNSGRKQSNVLSLLNDIARFVSDRQNVIKLLSNAVKNLKQGVSLNNNADTSRALLYPNLTSGSTEIPEMLEHMIEDESYDDYGPGSGKRFIIKDSQITQLTINEVPPPWTTVQVNGKLTTNGPSPPIDGGLTFGDGGNMATTAYAVDYDMWRMYGFKAQHPATIEMFTDATTQCAPYAVFLLNLARKNIFQGTVTVVGNEFIQAGEVYYIEDRDLLFYAETVTDSFTFGSAYTTQIQLKYGHNPGEYIPTMLDIIGKGLYSKTNQANLARHVRQGNSNGDKHLSVLVVDGPLGKTPMESLISGTSGEQNSKTLSNMMLAASGQLSPTLFNAQMVIEIRAYHSSKSSKSNRLESVAQAVREWILNPVKQQILPTDKKTLGQMASVNTLPDESKSGSLINPEQVKILLIDLDDVANSKSPSSEAWNIAKTIISNGNFTSKSEDYTNDALSNTLSNYVLDIYVVSEDPPKETLSTNMDFTPLNEAEYREREAAKAEYKRQIDQAVKSNE